ncbi:MAG TPA: glycosyltransferase family A protein [Aliidongia sp.]|uniref:glycosyltransferase family 2 protein n=1 Tax=Aliidongia sp. TaxID=1914230 RepID=UPI002DDDBAC1|nr:glycosyltransferase family A protein [Aliidongia sp.]HEV2677319.1 glycosyltransferase family A protein [Aliidongia sp.]
MTGQPGPPPLISVIIPCFNAAATISSTLASVRAQTYRTFEILVVDDRSSDATLDLVSQFAQDEPRLRLIRHERNQGPAAARNTGLAAAAGRYCAFLDADDEWLPDKLDRQVAALVASPQALLCCCNAVWMRDGVAEGTVYDGCTVTSGPDAWKSMLEDVYVGTPCAVVDTAAARRLGGFDPALRVGEDQDLWLKLAFAGEVVALPQTLVKYRRSVGSYMDRHRDLSITDWLPRLEAHVAARRAALTPAQYHRTLRRIYERLGRNAYRDRHRRRAARLLLRAIRHGAGPFATMVFLIRASAPARVLAAIAKRVLRH